MIRNFGDVCIQPNAEIGLLFPDLADQFLTRHAGKSTRCDLNYALYLIQVLMKKSLKDICESPYFFIGII